MWFWRWLRPAPLHPCRRVVPGAHTSLECTKPKSNRSAAAFKKRIKPFSKLKTLSYSYCSNTYVLSSIERHVPTSGGAVRRRLGQGRRVVV